MKLVTAFIIILLCFRTSAQQTSNYINNWYFGTSGGISFNGGTPVNIPSSITAYEVSTSYSDGAGNPLFYVGAISGTSNGNGFTIWDAGNTTMPNGDVSVDYSQSCGLTAVPVPGNCDQYYVFALAVIGGANYGLRYSVIDMTLPGNGTVGTPLGDVVAGQKDVLVFDTDTLAEKIKVIQQGNTENYWIVTRSVNRDVFYSFEVTAAGVNPTPVVSTISPTVWPTFAGSPFFGWLAVNKNRDIIAEANGFGPDVKLFRFDNITGIVSPGEVVIPPGTLGMDVEYGVEFSPSGDILYVNHLQIGGISTISWFDMTAGLGSIAPTRQDFVLSTGPSAEYGALVKAPDGKIYGSRFGLNQLTVINDPNNNVSPGIISPGYDPSPGSGIIGMPNNTYYYHPDNFTDTLAGGDRDICPTEQATIGAVAYDSIWSTYSWEPSAMVVNPSNAVTQTVPLSADQQFIVHAIRDCGDTITSDTVLVTVNCLILPVELTDFEAELKRGNSLLTWKTISELNNDKFIIEHSVDGHHFTTIGVISGAGTSQVSRSYDFTHESPPVGLNYYRLKQVDFNGEYTYSDLRTVNKVLSKANVYPNPFNDEVQVQSNVPIHSIRILSNSGKQVYDKDLPYSELRVKLSLSHLASGLYWIEIQYNDHQSEVIKMSKQ